VLKTGAEVSVLLEIHYPSEQDSPIALSRIQTQLQRTLNIHFSRAETLFENPYHEIDTLLQREIEPLRRELALDNLSLRTVDVKTIPVESPKPPNRGVYLGGT
jgi:hypothetical protein